MIPNPTIVPLQLEASCVVMDTLVDWWGLEITVLIATRRVKVKLYDLSNHQYEIGDVFHLTDEWAFKIMRWHRWPQDEIGRCYWELEGEVA